MAALSFLFRSHKTLLLGACLLCAGGVPFLSGGLTPLFSQFEYTEGSFPNISVSRLDEPVKEHDRALARLYTDYAVDFFREEALERADEHAETALLFNPGSPDALYIRAEAALSDNRIGEAEDFFSKSLLYDRWNQFEPIEARTALAGIYYRIGKVEDAYHLLDPNYTEVFDSVEQALLYTKILIKLEFSERALEAVRRGSGRFPRNEKIQSLRVRIDASYRERAEKIIREGDSEELLNKETYRSVISLIPEQEEGDVYQKAVDAGELLSMYEDRWGKDRFSRVYRVWSSAMQLREDTEGSTADEEALEGRAELFSEYDTFTDTEFALLRRAAESGAYEMSGFSSFDGEVVYDDNQDGVIDKRIEYADGRIEYMEWDMDQNYTPEVKIDFNGGEPKKIELMESESSEGLYGKYPNLVRVVYSSSPEEEFILDLVPYEIDFEVFQEENWDDHNPPTLHMESAFPKIDELLFYASKIERDTTGKVYSYGSEEGRSEMYSITTPESTVVGQYEGASLRSRTRELDGEEEIEITEAYENGELVYMSYDGTGDGRAEYMEVYEEEEIIRLWDIDEDGVFDYEMRVERGDRDIERETE